ncbi:MAG: hypothetical protein ACQEWM_05650 [Actinomycetota bacterium]
MISKWDALSLVAEVQAELAAELGEPAFVVESRDQSAPRPRSEADVKVIEAAEHRAIQAEKRAASAEKALRVAKRNNRSVITKRGSATPNGGVVVVKVDGERVIVKPGNTVEVRDGSIDHISPTPKQPFHAYSVGSIIHRDKNQ